MALEGIDHRHLRGDLLKRVSRSFYLSMRFLPAAMREPVSLGYLLARASDTLADTAQVPVAVRVHCLEQFRASVPETQPEFTDFYAAVMRDFAPQQLHDGERELLQRLPDLFAWLMRSSSKNREALIEVLEEITRGQSWDLERFGESERNGTLSCCESAEELETYAYRVAGSVGEFWTRVGFANLGSRFAEEEHCDQLVADGIAMGKGLQLVNILRDLSEDLKNGRCYLPRTELEEAGWNGAGNPDPEVLLRVSQDWMEHCRNWLGQGWNYAARLKGHRVRFATVLPLILAEGTLVRMEEAGALALETKVKISRAEVRLAMGKAIRFSLFKSAQPKPPEETV